MVRILLFIALLLIWTPFAIAEEDATAKAKVILNAEQKILGADYDVKTNTWLIQVKDDGSKRYGYAQYICETLKDIDGMPADLFVTILDHDKIKRGSDKDTASLGSVNCTDYTHHYP